MTGQTISAMGVWNVIQVLEGKVCEEEEDGVYIKLQGKDRKREKQYKAEIKIGIAYDGWRKTGPDRYALEDKVVVTGCSKVKEFHEY